MLKEDHFGYGILAAATCVFAIFTGLSIYHSKVIAACIIGILFLSSLAVTLYCRFKKEKNNENKK